MNYQKLKGKLREKSKTYLMCSQLLGISIATFSDKMNGKSRFYIDELDRLGDYLDMTNEERENIFLH